MNKKLLHVLAVSVIAGLAGLASATHTSASAGSAIKGAQDAAQAQAKNDLYKKFLDNFKGNAAAQKVAYDAGKEYLDKYGNDKDPDTVSIVKYVGNWVGKYEKVARNDEFYNDINGKKYSDAFRLGGEMLASNPDNLNVLIPLAFSGPRAAAANDTSHNADAVNDAKKAIDLINAGKSPDSWKPLNGKDDTLAYLNYTVGQLTVKSAPMDALPYLIKATTYESPLKKDPTVYVAIAGIYQTQYAPMAADYQAKFANKPETPESKAALAALGEYVDRITDALARSIAYSGTDPKYQSDRAIWKASLTDFYKYQHNNSTTGLEEYIAGITSKPLPEPYTPPATPEPSPAGSSGQSTGAASNPSQETGANSGSPKATPAPNRKP